MEEEIKEILKNIKAKISGFHICSPDNSLSELVPGKERGANTTEKKTEAVAQAVRDEEGLTARGIMKGPNNYSKRKALIQTVPKSFTVTVMVSVFLIKAERHFSTSVVFIKR